ncbi:uncharacterized protein LOC128169674 [Crassostrea angulata]|uniref:uncharacterized protein LOC128169674 n=1 Tax=Magallana angulata TaxID=2784310 RepID=UPI0022B1C5F9|nr:uncharacterized protein LOC128169674 [Crassostrea angulata]
MYSQRTWNNKTVSCEEYGGGERSEAITFNIKVPAKKVTFTYDKITVNVGQQINLTCQTDDCNPAAAITWYKESSPVMDSNFHISHTIGQFDLIKTTSVFMYTGAKDDNMQNVFCKASNWPGVTVESVSYSLNVRSLSGS